MLTLTAKDDKCSVTLAIGERFSVVLEENPTTGYRWTTEPSDLVAIKEERYSSTQSGIGASGLHAFTLIASAGGSGTLTLRLWRTWAGDSSVIKRFQVTLCIT
jgi:inhibitor of cysteine peptidase